MRYRHAIAGLILLAAGAQAEEALIRLAETPRLLETPDAKAQDALGAHCAQLDRRCLRFLSEHPELARGGLSDNPAYRSAYLAVLESNPAPFDDDQRTTDGRQEQITAAREWFQRRWLLDGALDADEVTFHLAAQRQRLAGSLSLIDKMIGVAITGITLEAVNVLMSQQGTDASPEHTDAVERLLEPLSLDERSLRTVMASEFAYRQALLEAEDLIDWRGHHAKAEPAFDRVAEYSELPWATFWRDGIDLYGAGAADVYAVFLPAFDDYLITLRYVDATLAVLRALQSFYAGRASPGAPPAAPPPPAWAWQWRGGDDALCLVPVTLHPSLHANAVCVEHLDGAGRRS